MQFLLTNLPLTIMLNIMNHQMVHGGNMSSITIHNLDPEMNKLLRERAQSQHTSLNQTIQKILKEALGLEKQPVKKSDFSDLSGTWTTKEAQEFEAATAEFSQIDKEMWK
jgi:plasmid stability protein